MNSGRPWIVTRGAHLQIYSLEHHVQAKTTECAVEATASNIIRRWVAMDWQEKIDECMCVHPSAALCWIFIVLLSNPSPGRRNRTFAAASTQYTSWNYKCTAQGRSLYCIDELIICSNCVLRVRTWCAYVGLLARFDSSLRIQYGNLYYNWAKNAYKITHTCTHSWLMH